MDDNQFVELAARSDALCRVVMHLASQLEDRGLIDGQRLQETLVSDLPRGNPMLVRSAELLQELMTNYSQARSSRRAAAMWSENRSDRNG